jgi:formamidopyrimidine-DNA glycosylase
MPELPEVETARRLIADEALGRRITDVDDSDTFVCRPHSPGELRAALTGRTLTAARRRGKTIWCETSEDGRLNPGIDALGPDAAEVTPADFRSLITRGSVAVKARLLDQSRIAGVGNLLADEILWQARVHPAARTDTLGPADADRLYRALESALESAAARGGVHTGDVIAARHPGGSCPRCGAEMRHGTVGGRSTWWCSREQVPGS